jgi:hypothetical protein
VPVKKWMLLVIAIVGGVYVWTMSDKDSHPDY